jgi:hypothetical protein
VCNPCSTRRRASCVLASLGIFVPWLDSCGGAVSEAHDSGVEATAEATSASVDAAACAIDTAKYGQSCTVDADCLSVILFNFCKPSSCNCEMGVIPKGAMGQYDQDLTLAMRIGVDAASCYCPFDPALACCKDKRCSANCLQ